jgi:hypothetical protein
MQIMIIENQGVHYGYKNEKNEIKAKNLFDEMYYPSSSVWKSKVIFDGYSKLSKMVENYEKFENK